MTRKWTEGWEFKDMIGYCTGSDYGVPVVDIETTIKRSGNASLHIGNVSNTDGWLYKTIDPVSELYLRFAVYLKPFVYGDKVPRIYFGTNDYLTFGSCYELQIYIGGVLIASGSTVLYRETWYLIELHIKKSATVGVVQARLDGSSALEIDFSGNTGVANVTRIMFWIAVGYVGEISSAYFDDIALNDTAGGVDNSWCGEGKIVVMMPNTDSLPLQLTPSAATAHYLLVDEVPTNGDTDYVEGSVINEEDMYKLTPSGLVNVDINRVWTEARTRKTAATDAHVALITKAAGGAEVSGGDVELLTTYAVKVLGTEQRVNPVDSLAWEVADIDLIEIGPRTR